MGRPGRRAKRVLTLIRRVSSKVRMKSRRVGEKIRVYHSRVVSEISLPYWAPEDYYLVDSSTFEKLLKCIDFLVSYSSWLEERILELAERCGKLEDDYTALLGRYYLLRNYVTRLMLREKKRDDYGEFEWLSKALEHDLSLMQLQANDYHEFDTTKIEVEREIWHLKRSLRRIYGLEVC